MKHKKLIIIGVISLAVIFLISALSNSTYALFSSDDYGANPNVYNTGNLLIEANSKSENISLDNALPMTDKEGKETTPYVFTIKNIGNLNYMFNVKLLSTGDSSTSFSSSYIRLQVDKGNVNTLSNLTDSVIKEGILLLAGESIDISIRIWLDEETPNSEIGKSFNSKIVIDGVGVYTESKNLVEHISNLYNNANKTQVENGEEGSKITYNYASSVSLMNDRQGTMSVGANDGNIRYYGATPKNYIDIGDTEINANGEEVPTLYRIIGLFKNIEVVNDDGTTTTKDLVKVIRNDIIGNYSWDTSVAEITYGKGNNEWSQADLMKLLNPEYESEEVGGSLYWNSGSGNCYSGTSNTTTACDFTSTGLNASAKDKITTVKWNTGGWNNATTYPNQIYGYERGENVIEEPSDGIERKTNWTGKVALSYPSDYGYAVDLTSCTSTLNLYKDSTCKGTNWMYSSITTNGGNNSWLLTPHSLWENCAWPIAGTGLVANNVVAGIAFGVSPVFYLDSGLVKESGDGSEGNPYVVR